MDHCLKAGMQFVVYCVLGANGWLVTGYVFSRQAHKLARAMEDDSDVQYEDATSLVGLKSAPNAEHVQDDLVQDAFNLYELFRQSKSRTFTPRIVYKCMLFDMYKKVRRLRTQTHTSPRAISHSMMSSMACWISLHATSRENPHPCTPPLHSQFLLYISPHPFHPSHHPISFLVHLFPCASLSLCTSFLIHLFPYPSLSLCISFLMPPPGGSIQDEAHR
jgi:hypothetical protein